MDPQCIYGSEPAPDAPDYFEWSASILVDNLPDPIKTAGQIAMWIAGLPIGQVPTAEFCATEILTDPPTEADWFAVTSPLSHPEALVNGAYDRVFADLKRHIWAHYCVCKAPPPDPDAVVLFDHCWTALTGTGTLGPFTIPGIYNIWDYRFYNANVGVTGDDAAFTTTLAPIPGSLDDQALIIRGPGETEGISGISFGDYLDTDSTTLSIGYDAGTHGLAFCVRITGKPTEAPPYNPPPLTGPGWTPPDPDECTLEELCAKVDRVYNLGFDTLLQAVKANDTLTDVLAAIAAVGTLIMDVQASVTNMAERVELTRADASYLRRGLLPDSYLPGEPSDDLTGEGTYTVTAGAVAIVADLVAIPESAGRSGDDLPAYYRIGYVQFGSAVGWSRKWPIVSDPTWYVGLTPNLTMVHYVLSPDVVIRLTPLFPAADPAPPAEEGDDDGDD